jgi:hypothetical protein
VSYLNHSKKLFSLKWTSQYDKYPCLKSYYVTEALRFGLKYGKIEDFKISYSVRFFYYHLLLSSFLLEILWPTRKPWLLKEFLLFTKTTPDKKTKAKYSQ